MKNISKSLLSLSFLLLIFTTLTGCQDNTEDQYDTIIERGYFTVGFDQTFAPMGFRDTDGEYKGFDIDLAKEVAEEMNLEVRFQPIDWSMKESELNNGNIDMIWNGYTITDEREEKVLFSDPYLANRQVMVILSSNTDINTKDDLNGKKVGVQTASSSYDAVMNETDLVLQFANKTPYTYKTNNDAFIDLEAKRIDAIVVDEILARYIISNKNSNQFTILDDDFGKEEYGIGFRKNDLQFKNAVNNAFNSIKQNDEAAQISVKWFGENIIK